MNGMKRKVAPSKDTGVKSTKKVKIDQNKKPMTKTTNVQLGKAKKKAEPSDSEDSDSDGGAALFGNALPESSGLDESDTTEYSSEEKAASTTVGGVHPERVKAAAANSKNP